MEAKEMDRDSRLIYYARRGFLGAVRRTVKEGGSLDVKDAGGFAPVHYLSARGEVPAVRFLLEHGADVNVPTAVGRTILFDAAARDSVAEVQYYLSIGADPNAWDSKKKHTPIYEATGRSAVEITALLLKSGADIQNPALTKGLLETALSAGLFKKADALITCGLNIQTEQGDRRSLIIDAVYGASRGDPDGPDIIRRLRSAGCGFAGRPNDMCPDALFAAAAVSPNAQVVKTLIGCGVPLFNTDKFGEDAAARFRRQRRIFTGAEDIRELNIILRMLGNAREKAMDQRIRGITGHLNFDIPI